MFAGVAEMIARAMVGFLFVPLWGYFAACIANPVAWFFACFFLIPAYIVVFRKLKQEKARLLDTDSDELADRTRDLMDALTGGPDFLDGFDAELFDVLVEKIIVDSNECLRFRLKNGIELTEQIERTRR